MCAAVSLVLPLIFPSFYTLTSFCLSSFWTSSSFHVSTYPSLHLHLSSSPFLHLSISPSPRLSILLHLSISPLLHSVSVYCVMTMFLRPFPRFCFPRRSPSFALLHAGPRFHSLSLSISSPAISLANISIFLSFSLLLPPCCSDTSNKNTKTHETSIQLLRAFEYGYFIL